MLEAGARAKVLHEAEAPQHSVEGVRALMPQRMAQVP